LNRPFRFPCLFFGLCTASALEGFIGLTNELVDHSIHPLRYRQVHHNPTTNPETPNPLFTRPKPLEQALSFPMSFLWSLHSLCTGGSLVGGNVETKRCLFGTFIGLTNELVDHSIHPLRYRQVHHNPPLPVAPEPWTDRQGIAFAGAFCGFGIGLMEKHEQIVVHLVDVETKRCLFGTFIGLTNELVDHSIHPLRYRLVKG
jgi:hypothetical protein